MGRRPRHGIKDEYREGTEEKDKKSFQDTPKLEKADVWLGNNNRYYLREHFNMPPKTEVRRAEHGDKDTTIGRICFGQCKSTLYNFKLTIDLTMDDF
jgi:hypothetical protein